MNLHSTTNQNEVAERVRALADEHHVRYSFGPKDRLAQQITSLSGDDVQLDETELLLVALQRAGVLDRKQAVLLQAQYLRQARP